MQKAEYDDLAPHIVKRKSMPLLCNGVTAREMTPMTKQS